MPSTSTLTYTLAPAVIDYHEKVPYKTTRHPKFINSVLCARLHARVKLGPGQKKPKRKAKNKKHLPKVMVLAGVASPRPGWDGKIGLWRAHKWVTVGRGFREPQHRPRVLSACAVV